MPISNIGTLTGPSTDGDFVRVTGTDLGGGKRGMDISAGGATSTSNSTTTPLNSGGTYTGTGEQNNFDNVGVMVKTDQAGTLYFDFSSDGTNWDSTFPSSGFSVAASVSEFHTAVKLGRYFRVRYVNGTGGAQTYLRLTTYFGNSFVPANAPLNQIIGLDQDATFTRTSDFTDEVVIGRRSGVRHFTQFAYRSNLTAANGEETVWAASGNFTPMTSASTFTITYNNASDGSSSNGAKTLYLDYIDSSGLYQTATHTLTATGSDVTSFTGLGINRIAVSSSGSTQTNGAAITVTETSGATVQAYVPASEGVTQQAIFFTDSNSYGVAKFLYFNVNKLAGASPKVTVKGYVFNRTVATKFEVFRHTIDSSVENTVVLNEPVGFRLSPADVLYFVADTDQNSTVITLRFSLLEYKIS